METTANKVLGIRIYYVRFTSRLVNSVDWIVDLSTGTWEFQGLGVNQKGCKLRAYSRYSEEIEYGRRYSRVKIQVVFRYFKLFWCLF